MKHEHIQTLTRRSLLLAATAVLGGCVRNEATAKAAGEDAKHIASAPAAFKGVNLTGASYGRDFRLKDTQGRERSLADFRGKVVLLHFGFTLCPDACPTELQRATEVKQLLGKDADRLQVLFFTLDPERDTPQVIAAYTAAFDPSFIGLYTDVDGTRQTAEQFRVVYRKVPIGDSYTMDHSTLSFAFDPAGRLRVGVRFNETADDCAYDLRQLLA